MRKRKWFLNCLYNPHRNSVLSHFECLNSVIDEHSKTYDSIIFIGDFDVSIGENSVKNFCDINCLKILIKVPTFFKNLEKTKYIYLLPTNGTYLFQHSNRFETGFSEFHLLTVTEFRMGFEKLKPKIIAYRDNKNFDSQKFRSDTVIVTRILICLKELSQKILESTKNSYLEILTSSTSIYPKCIKR